MRIGSLCSGYGGLDMAAEQVTRGTTAWHVEYNPDAAKILAHHWPHVPNHGDVKTTDWTKVEPVEVLTAGYPCQPFSHAGQRQGEDDARHLWPDVAQAVRVLRPRLVLLENVAGHLSLGFGRVLGDLAEAGYDASWVCLRAADVGAPHGRARVFIAATDSSRGPFTGTAVQHDGLLLPPQRGVLTATDADSVRCDRVPKLDTPTPARLNGQRRGHPDGCSDDLDWGAYAGAVARWQRRLGRPAPQPTEPSARGGGQRLSPRFVEWMMGLPDGHVTAVPGLSRNAQLTALGNGVVPQQAVAAYRIALAELAGREVAA